VRAVRGDRAGHAEVEVTMTPAWDKNEIGNGCFASCAHRGLLLKIFPEKTVRVVVQKMLPIQFEDWKPDGFCSGVFSPALLNKFNLTRCGIFRGKISQRKNQNQNKTKKALEERTQSAPN
jgi:hypothetical protein